MLIIEGADNLGKTTACKRLVELADRRRFIPAYYAHMGRPPERFDFKYDYVDRMSFFAVQDRFHLGSLIWHENVMYEHKLKFIEEKLAQFGSFVVVFYSSSKTHYEHRIKNSSRDEMFEGNDIIQANDAYRELASFGRLKGLNPAVDLTIDVRYDGEWYYPTDEQLDSILNRWEERLEHVRKDIAKMYR